MDDQEYMRAALSLARRGLGRAAPNPSVGCVIVKSGRIMGRGRTHEGGRPHAEAAALAQAGESARGATAYVTLEPCAVMGRDGPCAAALVNAGVKRVVVACIDPNPLVNGAGIRILKEAGIEVTENVLEGEAQESHQGFFLRVTKKRPMVTLKMAVTGDGMFAPASGKREWITGEQARRHVHLERSKHDAILSSIGTVINDNPLLTTRLKGIAHKPKRIILDSNLKIPMGSQLVRTVYDAPLWVFHTGGPEDKAEALQALGVRVFDVGRDLNTILTTLAFEGITRVLYEGGGTALKAFAEAGIGERFLLYKALHVKWPGGRALDFDDIALKLRLNLSETHPIGEDLLEIYTRKA